MSHNKCFKKLERRDFAKLGAASAAAGILGLGSLDAACDKKTNPHTLISAPGRVVKVFLPGMRGKYYPHPEAARIMVNKAVTTLAKSDNPVEAWSKFISPDDRVGIKINAFGGRLAGTMKEVTDAVIDGIRSVGIPDTNIMVFDQFAEKLLDARYLWQERPHRLRVLSHKATGYETTWIKTAGGGRGKLSRALTWATAIINLPVIKDHDLAGITCSMKNMVFGCVEKPHIMHDDIHNAIPHFYALEEIRNRVRLNLVDGSFCQYDGGPGFHSAAHTTHNSIYASTDPVAIDSIALEVVDSMRVKNNLKTLADDRRPATYLALAEKLGIGIASRKNISLETIKLPPFFQASA